MRFARCTSLSHILLRFTTQNIAYAGTLYDIHVFLLISDQLFKCGNEFDFFFIYKGKQGVFSPTKQDRKRFIDRTKRRRLAIIKQELSNYDFMKKIIFLFLFGLIALSTTMPIYAWTGTSESIGNTTNYNFGGDLSGMSERIGNTIHYRLSDGSTGIIEVDGDTFRYNLGNGNTGVSQTIGNTTQYNFTDGTNGIGETIGNTLHFNFTDPYRSPSLNTLPSPNYTNTRKFNYELPTTDIYTPITRIDSKSKSVDLQRFKIAQTGFDICHETLSNECPSLLGYFNERTNSYLKYPSNGAGGYAVLAECIERKTEDPNYINSFKYNNLSNEISNCSNAISDDYDTAKTKGCFDALDKCYELRIKCPIGATFISSSGECSCGFGEVLNETGTACAYYQNVTSVNHIEEKLL